jgi:hypothetical protein
LIPCLAQPSTDTGLNQADIARGHPIPPSFYCGGVWRRIAGIFVIPHGSLLKAGPKEDA